MLSTQYDSEKKLWSGSENPSPLFHENVTIARAVLYLLNRNPEKTCQISADDGSKRTNGEIFQDTLRIAVNLQKMGCQKGDVVGFVCRNSHNLTPSVLAALFLGAPVNALDVAFTKEEIVHMFGTTSPKFIFCDNDVVDRVVMSLIEIRSRAMIIVIGERADNFAHIDDLLDDNNLDFGTLRSCPPRVDRKSCGAIICSSGTTGLSKGVAMSHEALQLLFYRPNMTMLVEPTDSMFNFSSLYWLSGYMSMFMSFFLGIPRIITTKSFSPELMISIVKEYKVTLIYSSPFIVSELVNSPLLEEDSLASVKGYLCAGSLLSSELNSKFQNYLPNGIITVAYGLTECGAISARILSPEEASVGHLSAGVTAKIIDEDGKQLGVGEVGEVCVKTSTHFLGYYGNSEATKEIQDKDGWIHTGDIGHFDEEGLLYITGRNKDMFKFCNYQITPCEIENILESHPGVLQACVVGIPDPVYTNLPAAVVCQNGSVTEDELYSLVEKRVMDHKKLRGGIFFIKSFPMTISGKIQKGKVRELVINLSKARSASKL